jgi:asparagine synthase (glutamine-hydrolysing)
VSGVFGYVGTGAESGPLVVERMGRALLHRPYHVVETAAPTPSVGMGRHAIGLLNRAAQPVRSADGRVWLCLAGEFYHQQARRAELVRDGALPLDADDAALALATYRRHGPAGLSALAGAFAAAIWDDDAGEMVLVNDRYGLYPQYIARTEHGFVFAPEIKAMLTAPGVPRRLDQVSLAQYVRFQQMLGDRTWLEDVRLLPPATILRFRPRDGRLCTERYWDWNRIPDNASTTFDEAVEECARHFQRAVDAMTTPPLQVGVYLSGGLDSRVILGFTREPPATLTFGDPRSRDVVYAAELARRAGSRHHWFPMRDGHWVLEYTDLHFALTEGMHSWMHGHGMSTLDEARRLVDVNLSGWDGGTIMGGSIDFYRDELYRQAPSELDLAQRFFDAFCQRFTWPGLTEAEAASLCRGGRVNGWDRLAFDSLREELAATRQYRPERRADYFYIEQVLRRSLINQVVFTRSAIEVRCPYFDYPFVDFMYSLPDIIRTVPALRRTLITRHLPRLATVPHEKDDRLPHVNPLRYHAHALRQRARSWVHRHGLPIFPARPRLYADYEEYLRTDLRDWAEAILFDPRTQDRGLFDPIAVRALWDRHLAGNELWTIGKIAPMITIELALRTFLDETPMALNGDETRG